MGDREKNILSALAALEKNALKVDRVSRLIETEPVGGPPQARFLNGAARITTNLSPTVLLKKIKDIENKFNRVKNTRNGPRPVDIDILLYGKDKIHKPGLIIPHPGIFKRPFVMKPLKEICPDIYTYK